MGRKPDLTEEEQRLKDLIREAHEAAQHLWDAISVASKLTPTLVAEFEAHHKREMQQLSDHLNAEANRIAADMNAAVAEARLEIIRQLGIAELVLDANNNKATLLFNGGRFDDQVPPPRTHLHHKETDQ